MPRTAPSVPTSDLPEFMRSRTVGAIIAEALLSADNGDAWPAAYRQTVADAAGELREFHGLDEDEGSGTNVRPLREQQEDEREIQAAHDVHGTHG